MAQGADIRKVGYYPDCIGHAFAFGSGAVGRRRKAKHVAAQVQHGGFKAQPGACAWLIKQGSEFFPFADMGICRGIGQDFIRQIHKAVYLLDGEIQRVNNVLQSYYLHIPADRYSRFWRDLLKSLSIILHPYFNCKGETSFFYTIYGNSGKLAKFGKGIDKD